MKPLKITKVTGGYHVFLRDVPLVQGDNGKGITVDRATAGLSTTRPVNAGRNLIGS